MTRSFLYSSINGAPTGAPFIVLHKRNGWLEDAEELGTLLGPVARRVNVRSSRVQVAGPNGRAHGCFWFIGPLKTPELSTLGDGLYQLELLLQDEEERNPGHKMSFLAEGESAIVAMLMAMLWHDKTDRLILIDPEWPDTIDQMPIEPADLGGISVLLVADTGSRVEQVRAELSARGARVQVGQRADIAEFAIAK